MIGGLVVLVAGAAAAGLLLAGGDDRPDTAARPDTLATQLGARGDTVMPGGVTDAQQTGGGDSTLAGTELYGRAGNDSRTT
jgi:hypothetical protein